MSIRTSRLLRQGFLLDASVSGCLGTICLLGSEGLAGSFNLPQELLLAVGIMCLAWALANFVAATQAHLRSAIVWGVILSNCAWVLGSFALLQGAWLQPNKMGITFVVAQAIGVALLAGLQFAGLRSSKLAVTV